MIMNNGEVMPAECCFFYQDVDEVPKASLQKLLAKSETRIRAFVKLLSQHEDWRKLGIAIDLNAKHSV